MIDWTKPIEVQSVGGDWYKARDLGPIVGQPNARAVAYFPSGVDNERVDSVWLDCVRNAPEPKRSGVIYVNCYRSGQAVRRAEADSNACEGRLACKRVEWTEGEFDE